MNWVGGNGDPDRKGINSHYNPGLSVAENSINWEQRNLTTTVQNQKESVAWAYVIDFANLTQKDIWINIPIHASDSYITVLAQLLHERLRPESYIYIEYTYGSII